jgi:predicted ester cyclase
LALSREEIRSRTLHLYEEANKGNIGIFAEALAPDFVSYGGAGFQDLHGPEGFAGLYRTFLQAFPDLTFRVEDVIVDADLALARGTLGGNHVGDFMGMAPPTNKYISWTGSAFFRFNDEGLIDGRWQDWDGVAVMQQLGVVPGPYVPKGPAPTSPSNPGPTMSGEEVEETLRRFIEKVWNEGNLDYADELFHPQATSPSAPELAPGPATVKMLAEKTRAAFPDYHMQIEQIVGEEDKVGARFVQTGTHEGEFMGIAPTERRVEWTETGILRFEGSKVVESWYEADILGLLQQLGVGSDALAAAGG